jgi:nicotinamide-nucleotide amidase
VRFLVHGGGVKIEIINTGSELLLGNVQNTHGAWLGRELFLLGLRVARQTTIPDGAVIEETLAEAVRRSDAVIVTGGLGPTSDDITREATAAVLGCELIEDEAALRSLEEFFSSRKRVMAPNNRKQALAPVGADVLPNHNGTAPGIYVPPRMNPHRPCAIFLLPGPPRELYPMFFAEVEPRLRSLAGVAEDREMVELKFTGVGESDFHQAIDDKLAQVEGLEYGYCARISEVDLRLIGSRTAIEAGRGIAETTFGQFLISDDRSSMEEVALKILRARGMTLATAESCTGGLVASRLTDIPGSSEVLTHGWVTYSNRSKVEQLGVAQDALDSFGAVSEEVARQMAEGALRVSQADVAVSVTGIAGPGGGTAEKPVGTAWIAIAQKGKATIAEKVFHLRDRNGFKKAASQSALDLIRRHVGRQD